jgi:hypothetical protein
MVQAVIEHDRDGEKEAKERSQKLIDQFGEDYEEEEFDVRR